MPDNLQGDIRTGFDSNAAFDLRLDTFKTMDGILNRQNDPYLPKTIQGGREPKPTYDFPEGFSYEDALVSKDPKIRDLGVSFLEQSTLSNPYISSGLANEIRTPYDRAKKYINKKYGYDATIPDIEDFYYEHSYMDSTWVGRNLIQNPLRFLGRVVVPAVLKLGQGLGYVGNMITSIGSENYWADVADNGLSKWLGEQEQSFKDNIIPVYHQAGFDEKGFFSKLLDWSFWNEDVADGVAFMGSAMIPAVGLSKLGTASKFGRPFSATSAGGRTLSKVGLGSPAELTAWTLNTAMEASTEAAGVFKYNTEKMKELRRQGIEGYTDLSDEDIRKRAGSLASNIVGGNFLVLALSNAWENTLFFKGAKKTPPGQEYNTASKYISSAENFGVESKALKALDSKNPFASSLSRTRTYGGKAIQGFVAEGLWEENAQLVIQRMNTIDDTGKGYLYDGKGNVKSFFGSLIAQTDRAFSGKDDEAMTSIGLGAIIGIGSGVGFSKLSNERKKLVRDINMSVAYGNSARDQLFAINDVYQRDDKNQIVYENNQPRIDPKKLETKRIELEKLFGKLQLSTLDEFNKSKAVEFDTMRGLANYVRSMQDIGIDEVSKKFSALSKEQAALFGMDPSKISDKAGKYAENAKMFEDESKKINNQKFNKVTSLTDKEQQQFVKSSQSKIYRWRTDSHVLSTFANEEQSLLLDALNTSRSLTNNSLDQYTTEQLNTLLYQKHFNNAMMNSPMYAEMSQIEKDYHTKRGERLDKDIEEFKKNNDLANAKLDEKGGYYHPLRPDGTKVETTRGEYLSLQKIANYSNEIEKNNYFADLLSDSENWYNVYLKLGETAEAKKIADAQEAAVKVIEKSPFANYEEKTAGDFSKVARLVGKIVAGEQVTSREDLQTQQNYTQLIEDLIPLYTKALETNRKELIASKVGTLRRLRDSIIKTIQDKKDKVTEIAATVSSTSDIVTELQLSLEDGNTINANKLKAVIYKAQDKIFKIQKEIDALEQEMENYDNRIQAWEKEIEDSDIPLLKKELADLKDQKILLELEIGDVKGILQKIAQLITDLIKIARRLIPNFSVKRMENILEPSLNTYGEANREAYAGTPTMDAYQEIKLKQDERDELKLKLKQLEGQYTALDEKVTKWEKLIQDIEKAALKEIEGQYLAITRQKGKAPIVAPEEQKLTDSYGPNFTAMGTSVSIINMAAAEQGLFDGNDYIRPLTTKFFTSTFSDVRTIPYTQAEEDHFQLLDLLSNSNLAQEAKKKLGKGQLKVIAVNRNNVDKLGLKDLLYTKINKDGTKEDVTSYYNDDDIDNVAIALVHVIEEGGKIYFIDKDLKRLGEISNIDNKAKKTIVHTVLRASRFKTGENEFGLNESEVYSIKNTEEQKEKAVQAGRALREKIFVKSKTFDVAKPNTLFPYKVTKGVANKFENADKSPVKNSITQTLITDAQIDENTVVVTTDTQKGKYTLNEQSISLPVGRAFIKTSSVSDQIHYADNNVIDSNLATTVLSVFSEMTKEYVKLLEQALSKDLRGRKLSEIQGTERTKLLIKFNSLRIKHFSIDYLNYLNSVVNFGTLEPNEIPHPNKIYLSGDKIHFGIQDTISITDPDDFLTSKKARDFVESLYHNVRYFPSDNKRRTQPFTEYYVDNNELKTREWKTYNHYLLQDKLPDGKPRTYIPITTSIKTAEQHSLEKDSIFPAIPYKSQAIILDVPFVEGVQKNVVKTDTKTTSSPASSKKESRKNALAAFEQAFKEEAASQNAFTESWVGEENDEEGETNTFDEEEGSGEEAFRVVTSGFFKTEEDLDGVIAYAAKVLPQFPVQRLKSAIQTMDGREAFGQFTGSMIKIWENAEEGSLYHEVFEGVANRLLKDYEWNAMFKEFKGRNGSYIDRESNQTLKYKDATPQQAKEQMAEEFRTYKLTGQLPSEKNTRTFFQMILDFIKKYILMRPTIDGIFKAIDESKYADRTVRGFNRFFSNYSIIPKSLPVADNTYYDFLQGFTSLMFQDIFQSPQSLSFLDEAGEIDETLYERIKAKIDALYSTRLEKIVAGTQFPTKTSNKLLNDKNKMKVASFKKGNQDWEKVKGDWGNFVRSHKFYLRKFRIKFNEEYNISEEEDQMKNMNDYLGNSFKISQKNSASASIRFLVGTLVKSKVEGVTMSANQIFPKNIRTDSSVYLPELENYDKMMLLVLDRLTGLNRIDLIEEKLRELGGISSLQNASVDEQMEVAKAMNSEQAAISLLYMRLFASKLGISPEAEMNLRTKFLNYVSKQHPNPWIYMIYDGEHQLINSTSRPFYESFYKRIQSSLIHNITDIFSIVNKAGTKTYVSKIKDGDKVNIKDFLSKETSTGKTKIFNFLKFLGIEETITPEFLTQLSIENETVYKKIINHIFTMRNALIDHSFTGNINLRNVNLFKYTRTLVEILEQIAPQSEKSMSYLNGDNESVQLYVPPSFVSRVMSEINNAQSFEELTAPDNMPHLKSTFSSDSIILARMFESVEGQMQQVIGGERTKYTLEMGYVEGIKNADGKFTKAVKMEEHQRLGLEFVMNLAGKYFSLPADSETEWIFDFGEFVKYSDNIRSDSKMLNEMLIPKLRSEIQTALEFEKHKHILNLNKVENGYVVGQSLRFFKNMLSPALVTKIHEEIKKGRNSSEAIITDNIKAIRKDILSYLDKKVDATLENLLTNRIISTYKVGENSFYHIKLPTDLKEKFGEDFTQSQIENLVAYGVVNSHIGNMEQFKLFFGDVAQYKDWEKRAKSLFSPIEQTYYDDNGTYNEWLNTNKNFAEMGEDKAEISPNDLFHTTFRNYLTSRTVDDVITVNTELVNKLNELGIKFASKFEATNEPDGQSVATIQAIRQLMMKAGWRWTKTNEQFFQYDTALARQELSETGRYTYTSEELRRVDEKILETFKANPPIDGISPIKTSMPSVRPDGTMDLIKHSVYPISYQLAKDMELLDTYLDLLKRGDDMLNFGSAHKVGQSVDNEGLITSMYGKETFVDSKGNSIVSDNPYVRTDLESAGTPQFKLSFRTIGIQVETQSKEKGTSFGTQMSKDILINLMPNGVPSDFREINPELSEQEVFDKWTSLSPEERDNSEDYRLAKDNIRALENLKEKSVMDTFDKIGVGYDIDDNGKIEYYPQDLKKLQTFILDQMLLLEIDENTIEGLKLKDDLTQFQNSSESLPSYDVVSNIIWSIADKSINHMKMNGTPYIQVASTFFNKEARKAAYKDEKGVWHTVNNKEDFDRLQKEGKKLVLTSSELKFYSLTEDGKTINAMEVYLPHIYKRKVNKRREVMGLKALSDTELMDYLNKNPKLLEGIGFRIPTQAKSSMEFFIIKGFLHESFGKSIVVPSDITTKAGSDFDVDKLSTYLNNWKINKQGYPEYEQFETDNVEHTDGEYTHLGRGRMGRYIKYIQKSSTKDDTGYIRALAKGDKQEFIKEVKAIIQQIRSTISNERKAAFDENWTLFNKTKEEIANISVSDMDLSMSALFDEGKNMFRKLSDYTKNYYWSLKESLQARDINGPMEIFEYLELTEMLLSTKDSGIVGLDRAYMREMATIYNLELDLFQKNKDLRKQYIESAIERLKVDNISVKEYYANKTKERIEDEEIDTVREEGLFDLDFNMAKEIGNLGNLLTFEKFSKLPIHLQNTRGAVENAYFETSRNILKQGKRFDQLLSPNNMDNIKNGKKAVYSALGIESSEANAANYLDINYLVKKRQAFAKGKYDIGIFAIGMTNYANSQIATIGIGDTITDRDDYKEIMKLNEGDISLPFDEVDVLTVDDTQFIPLSPEKDINGKYVMDNLSGYITGAVDVAKEPDIVEMGMHTELASSYLILTRAKVDEEKIALYMFQPAIREYLKELIFFKNQEFGYTLFQSHKELRAAILEKYAPKNTDFERINLTKEQLIDMIKKGEAIKKGDKKGWTETEKRLQYLAFVNFLKLKMFADDLGKNYRSSNHDTAKVRSTWSMVMKDLIADDLRQGNSIVSASDGTIKNAVDAFREDTFIQKTVDLFNVFNTIFSDINLFALQKDNPRTTLIDIAKNLYDSRFFITEDNFSQIMKEYSASMVDSLLNNHTTTDYGYTVTSYIDTFFKEGSKTNIFNQLEGIKKIIPIKDNFFLSNLSIELDQRLGVYTIGMRKNLAKDDVLSKNLMINGWRRLFMSPHKEVRDFAKALAMSSIIQFGVKAQRQTLTPIIPLEVYSQFSEAAFSQIDTVDFSTFEEEVIRGNSYKKDFVLEDKPFAMEFLGVDGKVETIWANRSKDDRDNKRRPKLSGKIFIRELTADEKKAGLQEYYNKPVFFWKGYVSEEEEITQKPSQFLVVKMVRPNYVTRIFDEINVRWDNIAKKEVYEMTKKKDFSWSYIQLYKLVGADGNSPTIFKKEKVKKGQNAGKMSISYLYKPVNSSGYFNFNESAALAKDDVGNVVGEPSSLAIHYPITEQPDDNIYKISKNVKGDVGYMFSDIRNMGQGIITEGTLDMGLKPKAKEKEIPSIQMQPQNIVKIAQGTKTTTVRSTKQSRAIAIPEGKTEIRKIGGDLYNVTNKGYLTIEEAGGMAEILRTEGIDAVEALKYQQTKDWIAGKGKLWVYNIQPIIKKNNGDNQAVIRVISGGQHGGDMGGIRGALRAGVETGGTAPPGFIQYGKGSQKELLQSFGLEEGEQDPAIYPKRTMKNVDDSDGTVAFLWGASTGTEKTIGYAQTKKWQRGTKTKDDGHKPVLVITTRDIDEAASQLKDFLKRNNIQTLNVAGHRESSKPGIEKFVEDVIYKTLSDSNLPPIEPTC